MINLPTKTVDVNRLTPPCAASATVIYAVGDIHGRLDLLEKMESAIAHDIEVNRPGNPLICYLGDYIDRGAHSAQVIERLCGEFGDDVTRIFLKGNHEDRMIEFLSDPIRHGRPWIQFGGREALESYGIHLPERLNDEDWEQLRNALDNALPASHRAFLTNLQLGLVWRDYVFVHAGLNPEAPIEAQRPEDLLWIREPFLSSDRDWGRIVVHGHVIVDEPEIRHNRIGIDTGAYRSGRLSSLVVNEKGSRILQVAG